MNKFKVLFLVMVVAAGINISTKTLAASTLSLENPQATATVNKTYQLASPLDIVARPNYYINKNIKIRAKFDKFSTLGLDYKPAMRSSEDYISFLIQRPDVRDHNIPLSELKIFIKRTEAEKYIELSSGDEIEFSGRVFSSALGDAWMDIDTFTVLNSKATNDKGKK